MARSRNELEAIIDRGESVLLADGRVVTNKEELPTAIELAGNDIVKKAHAIGDLIAARAALDAQIAEAGGEEEESADAPPKTEAELVREFQDGLSGYINVAGPERAKALVKAGFTSREKVLAAKLEDLQRVKGFETPESVEALLNLLKG